MADSLRDYLQGKSDSTKTIIDNENKWEVEVELGNGEQKPEDISISGIRLFWFKSKKGWDWLSHKLLRKGLTNKHSYM